MSRLVFERILNNVLSATSFDVVLGEGDREQLYLISAQVLESGFEYVCEMENAKLFRKRK